MINLQGTIFEEGTLRSMKFNNFLNWLGIRKIYALLLTIIILFILFVYFLVRFIFHVDPPAQSLNKYLQQLQKQNFHEASQMIQTDERATWKETFATFAQDEEVIRSLYFFFWEHATWDVISEAKVTADHTTLRVEVTSPDVQKILTELRQMAESGKIDMSDSEIVRPASNQESSLYYYLMDYYENFNEPKMKEQLILNLYLEGAFTAKEWKIKPTEMLHDVLSGYTYKAAEQVFSAPLSIPKS